MSMLLVMDLTFICIMKLNLLKMKRLLLQVKLLSLRVMTVLLFVSVEFQKKEQILFITVYIKHMKPQKWLITNTKNILKCHIGSVIFWIIIFLRNTMNKFRNLANRVTMILILDFVMWTEQSIVCILLTTAAMDLIFIPMKDLPTMNHKLGLVVDVAEHFRSHVSKAANSHITQHKMGNELSTSIVTTALTKMVK